MSVCVPYARAGGERVGEWAWVSERSLGVGDVGDVTRVTVLSWGSGCQGSHLSPAGCCVVCRVQVFNCVHQKYYLFSSNI